MFASLVDSAGKEASINYQQMSGYKTRSIRGEKNSRAYKFVHPAEASHRRAHQELLASGSAVEQGRIQICAEQARSNRVDAHSVPRPFHGERLRQRSHGCLAG